MECERAKAHDLESEERGGRGQSGIGSGALRLADGKRLGAPRGRSARSLTFTLAPATAPPPAACVSPASLSTGRPPLRPTTPCLQPSQPSDARLLALPTVLPSFPQAWVDCGTARAKRAPRPFAPPPTGNCKQAARACPKVNSSTAAEITHFRGNQSRNSAAQGDGL